MKLNLINGGKRKKPAELDGLSDDSSMAERIDDFLQTSMLPAEAVRNNTFRKVLKSAGEYNRKMRKDSPREKQITTKRRRSDVDYDEDSQQLIKEELDETSGLVSEVWLDSKQRNESDSESSSSDDSLMWQKRPAKSAKSGSSPKSAKIDLALSKMLIASSIPFEVVDSKHFMEFVRELNPDYRLPRSHNLKDKVLDGITTKTLK